MLASLDQWSWAMLHCNSAGTGGRSTGSLSRSATPSEQGEFGSTVIYRNVLTLTPAPLVTGTTETGKTETGTTETGTTDTTVQA